MAFFFVFSTDAKILDTEIPIPKFLHFYQNIDTENWEKNTKIPNTELNFWYRTQLCESQYRKCPALIKSYKFTLPAAII